MKQIDCFLLGGEREGSRRMMQELQESPVVHRVYELTEQDLWGSEIVRLMAGRAEADYTLIYTKGEPIEWGAFALERLIQVAESASAGMAFSDFYEVKEGKRRLHPLIAYQKGSLRDDFDFGSIRLYRTSVLQMAAATGRETYRFAGLYDLRLKVSQIAPVVHINEPLYTVFEPEQRKPGEKQFDYVDPKNRDVQIEMEQACTSHLKQTGGYLEPVFKPIDLGEETFETEASVIIPVRNRIRTIRDAIRSVLKQETAFAFNLIVVDNHSTDGTTEAIRAFAEADRRVILLCPEREDLGIGGCWNLGVHHPPCGKFAVQLDSDDVYSDEHTLQKIVDAFYEQQCAMVVGTYRMTDFHLETIPPGIIDHREWTDENGRNNALRINGLGAPRAFYTPLLRRIHLPDTSYGEDYAAGLRISREYRIGRIYEVLYLCRRWEDNSDASPDVVKMNAYNTYKDRIRTWELEARIRMNREKDAPGDASCAKANQLLARQLDDWPLARENYDAWKQIAVKTIRVGDSQTVRVQYNPARIVSAGAKTDAGSIARRKCFLCFGSLPPEQAFIPFGNDYMILVNPYPIFPQHFTIATRTHTAQQILGRFPDLLEMARRLEGLTLFYNGPASGASAPDHAHFQAVTPYYMPLDAELEQYEGEPLLKEGAGVLYLLVDQLRSGFVIRSTHAEEMAALFQTVYENLPLKPNEAEPMMNLFCYYRKGEWRAAVIPRKAHRPRQFYAEGDDRLLSSPGAADVGGLFITPLEKDFAKMDETLLRDVFRQIGYDGEEIRRIAARIVKKR